MYWNSPDTLNIRSKLWQFRAVITANQVLAAAPAELLTLASAAAPAELLSPVSAEVRAKPLFSTPWN
jgi:hypothetical protein